MAILIVDDDPDARLDMARALLASEDSWEVRTAETVEEGIALAIGGDVDCVLLDYQLPDGDGLSCLRDIRRLRPDLAVIMVTGSGSTRVAVEAMKAGAVDYIEKQGTYARIVPGVVREVLGQRALACLATEGVASPALPALDAATLARFEQDGFIARSPAMLRVLALVERAARAQAEVLIEGESGTGKELCARAIHAHGPRAAGPFVPQNCAAVPESLLETELFGHVRGAFTGANQAHRGLFDQADGGTLFLDEIGEAGPAIQTKLLRVLPEREFRPVGGSTPHRVDVRLVAATNRDLRQDAHDGKFRLDLYHRLRVIPIVLPPLRQRRDDIVPLAEHFLERFARAEGVAVAGFEAETLAVLERHAWPGNVRELANEVHRMVLAAKPGARIGVEAVDASIVATLAASPATEGHLTPILRRVEAALLTTRLREHNYRRTETAASLGITREALWKKLRALGLAPPGKRRKS